MNVDGIVNEQNTNFVGKDGFYWWIGEIEDHEDPLNLGRVKCRVLNYYTNPEFGSPDSLPTQDLPWATVLQGTDQAGNDGQGHSSGQLQPGAIVMGFFMDGESAQMPVVMGVLRVNKGENSTDKRFIFTGEQLPQGLGVNAATTPSGEPNTSNQKVAEPVQNNSVAIPNNGKPPGTGSGSPQNVGNAQGISGSAGNSQKPLTPEKPIPAANGVGGPWKTLEYQLQYLCEDIANTAGNLVRSDSGEFIDVVENKVVTLDKLLTKIRNFLSAVFAQVVSAIRLQLDQLVQQIEGASFITSFFGIPGTTFAVIQSAISAILSLICGIDQSIINFINAPMETIVGLVEGVIEGLISKAQMAVQAATAVIDQIVCQVQSIIQDVIGVIQVVKGIVDAAGDIQDIIETWQTGSEIFTEGYDLVENGITDLVGILMLLLNLFDFGCDREANGGKKDVGWYPFFGTTGCNPTALAAIPMGNPRGNCGSSSSGGGFLDSFFAEADPYLTSAKNFISGAYEMQMGTPGRQATIKKDASGKTTTSIKQNNASLADHKAKAEIRRTNPDLTEDEIESQLRNYRQSQSGSDSDQGNMCSDHTSYPGNHTHEVHGDDCGIVDGDFCRTISGDYRIKVTGDCHLEVGGGFFLNASGAPKQADNNGQAADDADKIQKHVISLGSDLEINTAGAGMKFNATNIELGARDLKLSGSSYENSFKTATYSPGEFVINAGNAITMNTTTLTQNVNFLPPTPGAGGYYCNVGGPVNFLQIIGGATAVPPFSVTTPGPFLVQCAAGGASFTVGAGAFNVKVAAGAISMSASAAVSIEAAAAMTLTAGAVMKLTAATIFLN
tara:strand:- start:503 stop:3013 length:2511 start_codon:yes stop_codon:yes gene_type:complete